MINNTTSKQIIKRGDIYIYDFGNEDKGSLQRKRRAVAVVSNFKNNRFSNVVLVCPITSSKTKKPIPTHVVVDYKEAGLLKESTILCEQIHAVEKSKLEKFVCSLNNEDKKKLNKALEVSIEVGAAEDKYNLTEFKVAREKTEHIQELDNFIKLWIDRRKDIKLIYDIIEERQTRIEELKEYCISNGLSCEYFYNNERMKEVI